jgi:hypothetical protein
MDRVSGTRIRLPLGPVSRLCGSAANCSASRLTRGLSPSATWLSVKCTWPKVRWPSGQTILCSIWSEILSTTAERNWSIASLRDVAPQLASRNNTAKSCPRHPRTMRSKAAGSSPTALSRSPRGTCGGPPAKSGSRSPLITLRRVISNRSIIWSTGLSSRTASYTRCHRCDLLMSKYSVSAIADHQLYVLLSNCIIGGILYNVKCENRMLRYFVK